MAGTRSSARLAANASSSPQSTQDNVSPAPGDKRKGGTSASGPKSKKGKKNNEKEQTTIEQSTGKLESKDEAKDVDMKEDDPKSSEEQAEPETNGSNANGDTKKEEAQDAAAKPGAQESSENAVHTSTEREESTPSSILEKGIIYFFFRARVNVDDPSSPDDVARSYMVLRPIPHGTKLGEGPIGDAGKNRLLALPKKVLPKSPRDRFMTFVEKANTSMEDIKTNLQASDYATKTAGTRHAPAVSQGKLATTRMESSYSTCRLLLLEKAFMQSQKQGETHIWRISLPFRRKSPMSKKTLVCVNKEATLSAPKTRSNPLPQMQACPKVRHILKSQFFQSPLDNHKKLTGFRIMDEFSGRRWMPLHPKLLDYENTQFLLIGHGDNALDKATAPQPKDQENEKEEPKEEMENLEDEDEKRVEGLNGLYLIVVIVQSYLSSLFSTAESG